MVLVYSGKGSSVGFPRAASWGQLVFDIINNLNYQAYLFADDINHIGELITTEIIMSYKVI